MGHGSTPTYGAVVGAPMASAGRQVLDLAGDWALQVDPQDRGLAEGWAAEPLETDLRAPVPGCVQSVDGLAGDYPPGHGQHNTYLGTAWLERTFRRPECPPAGRVRVKFGGMAPGGHVWFNGRYVGYHRLGMVACAWDVTDLLTDGENRLTVAVIERDAGLLGGMRHGGQDWSGLYRTVEVECVAAVHVEDLHVQPDVGGGRLRTVATVRNAGAEAASVDASLSVATWPGGEEVVCAEAASVTIEPGQTETVRFDLDASAVARWWPDDPVLHVATVSLDSGDELAVRFGMRNFGAAGTGLELNGRPFFAAGAGSEYASPTISPLTDPDIIRARMRAMKELGFVFYRYHTYTPTDEELDIADETGLLLSSEVPVVSNFGRAKPFEPALDQFRAHVRQTRNHPSLGIYCLGNENSQCMLWSSEDRDKARTAYAAIKELSGDHAVMAGFGHQGEHPDVPNDIESPHLWSKHFTWAYDGLTAVPWSLLGPILSERPCIIHEYGKFTSWPDPAEDALFPATGVVGERGAAAQHALAAGGLGELQPQILANSRRLAWLSARIAMEQARRQPGCDGYSYWSGWRTGHSGKGFCDDLGARHDRDPAEIRETANAPVAVLIDRDFGGRTLVEGQPVEIAVTLSNFGRGDVRDARFAWRLAAGAETVADGTFPVARAILGKNQVVGEVRFTVPVAAGPTRAVLSAQLESANREPLGANAWDFWLLPRGPRAGAAPVICDFAEAEFLRRFRAAVPWATGLTEFDSLVRGCRCWLGMDLPADIERIGRPVLVADRWTEAVDVWLQAGRGVLLLDTEKLPDEWYPAPTGEGAPDKYDQGRFFAPFRSGWDRGNIATIVSDHPAIGRMPHEGFCDLQFYAMVQGARALRTAAVLDGRDAAEPVPIVRSIAKATPGADWDESTRVEDRAYLLATSVGSGRLLVNSLRLLDDPAGLYLLGELLRYLEA